MIAGIKFRHVDPNASTYTALRTAVGFGRGRFGSAKPIKVMAEELAARAPLHGEGALSKPDPLTGLTIQPDGTPSLPPEFVLDRQREGAAAYGAALEELKGRTPQHDEILAEHLDLSYDGETVSHERLEDGISESRRVSVILGAALLAFALVASAALVLAGWTHSELGAAARQIQELRGQVEQLRQDRAGSTP
jgi:hypothetical protein